MARPPDTLNSNWCVAQYNSCELNNGPSSSTNGLGIVGTNAKAMASQQCALDRRVGAQGVDQLLNAMLIAHRFPMFN